MEIPGSQARLLVGTIENATLASFTIFRFRRASIRARAPRIDVTNSEGLPGSVRGSAWPVANATAEGFQAANPLAGTFPSFKKMPYESQLPGVGVCDIEIEQPSWDIDQIVYQVPTNNVRIVPQRYFRMIFLPVYFRATIADAYSFYSIYVEEVRHAVDVKEAQPVTVTGYSNGPWSYPQALGMPDFSAVA